MDQFDIQKQSEELQKTTVNSIQKLFPIKSKDKTLKLTNIWVEDDLDPNDFDSQFKAKSGERTWGVPVYGAFDLIDKEGKVVQKAKKIRLVTLPKMTPRLSYIIHGSEHQIANQLRLRPAGYTVRSATGGVKSQINLAKGYSGQIELHAKPETGVFTVKIGQANQRLYPILNALGISDRTLSQKWGPQVLEANKSIKPTDYDTAVKGFAKSVLKRSFANTEDASEALRGFVKETSMDPNINQRTVGQPHGQMTGEFLSDLSSHLLGTLQGKNDPHDRNALEFKEYRQLKDLIDERLSMKEFKNKITKKIQNNLNARENIEDVVNASVINPHIEAVFNLPELHQLPKQLNPLDMINTATLVTIMGPGGIQDRHTITDDMRNVHPSHLGYLDPIHTPETQKVGVTYHLPVGVEAKGRTLQTRAINVKTNKLERIDPGTFADSVVAFPGQYDPKTGSWTNPKEVLVLGKGNKTVNVPAKEVDYVLQSPKQIFSLASNLTPFLSTNNGGRALVASKLAEQAVPLVDREAPLVQSTIGGKVTFEDLLGDAFAFRSPANGVVQSVSPGKVVIKDNSGEKHTVQLYSNFPLNAGGKGFIDSELKVKKGDVVSKDQLLADTTFTKDGILAMGKNLRTAYMPYKGYNFEDGIVITDDAAKKLTSHHMYVESAAEKEGMLLNRNKFVAYYPNVYNKNQISILDANGVVKEGTILQPGDPIITKLRKEEIDPENIIFGKLSRTLIRPWKDDSIKWEGDTPAEVTQVLRHGNKVKVYMKTKEPAQIGDKLVGRFGNKGIITKIIPANEAPHDKDGNPVDILLNPHGIVTRINIGQLLENAASKVAQKTGNRYVVDNFSPENYTNTVKNDLDKHGLSDTEELFDPVTNKPLGKVNVGNTYILKLEKQVRSQFSARGAGPGWRYSQSTQEPVKGGEEGSKALDLLTFYSMLAHGARNNLREMATYKATKNDDFWNALKTGSLIPPPKPTFAYNKFISYMKASGVDVKHEGSSLTLAPMTDNEVGKISNGAVKEPMFVRAKDLAEIKGGFMDRNTTGGTRGTKWSHIDLAEPIVNPVFEQPVKTLLGIDNRTFDGLVEGRTFVDENGEFNSEGRGLTSGNAFKQLLSQIDKKQKLDEFTDMAKKSKNPDQLDKANKGIRFIEALNRFNLKPEEAYVQSKIPVLPPIFRPIYVLPNGNLHTSGVNFLYRDLGLASQKLKWQNDLPYMPEDAKAPLRKDLYNGAAAVAGLANPIVFYPPNRPVRGLIEEIKGVKSEGSKSGFFQKHVLRREQDLVGRGTIIPEPKLGIDEVGLPEDMSWTIFRPFVIKELINQGYKPIDADKEIEKKSFIAQKALEAVMNERPVMLNRAPSLHKFSVMAFKPTMVSGRAIKIPPLIVKGFNADFDGDTMTVHVPIMPKAVEEAKGMMPSKHLFNPGSGGIIMAPAQEAVMGLYLLTKDGVETGKTFEDAEKLNKALENKELNIDDIVTLAGKRTTAGKAIVDSVLPEKYRGRDIILDKKSINSLLTEIAKNDPGDYATTVEKLTNLGNHYSYQRGFTVSLNDLQPDLPEKDRILSDARKRSIGMSDPDKVKLYTDVDKKIKDVLHRNLKEQENNLYNMVSSGSRGDMDQLKQIVSAPLLVEDATGATLPIPIEGSFSHGLSIGDYWNSLYGARKGVVDKQLQTQKPGEFNKDLMATVVKNVISSEDCNTNKGIEIGIDDQDIHDRVLAEDIKVGSRLIARKGDIVDANLVSVLTTAKVKKASVRSPLTCEMPYGTCAHCYGVTPEGRMPAIGDNIGAITGQSMTEPLTQMVLRSMHSGGMAGTGMKLTGYEKIDKLVRLPKIIVGKATLAEKTGKVSAIEEAPAGGKNVYIGDEKHYVSVGNPLKVKMGSPVKIGDPISEGLIHPRELVDLKGMLPAQMYMVDELTNAYRDTGINLKKKNVETVVRSLADTTTVLDGGDSPYVHGDIIPYTMAEAFNRSAGGKIPLEEAEGKPLFKDHGPVKAGTTVNKRISKILGSLGYNEVNIGPEPILHEPFIEGIKQLPLLSKDWMAQMGYGHIAQGIKEGAGEAWTTELHGYSPVPAFAYGADFGLGTEGKY